MKKVCTNCKFLLLVPFACLCIAPSLYTMQIDKILKDPFSYSKIRLPEELTITKEQALTISDEAPAGGAYPESLILAPSEDGTYHYAKVLYPDWGNKNQYIHDFVTKKTVVCCISATRTLKIVPQILYQPRSPELLLSLFFQGLYERIQQSANSPYLTARIIPPNGITSVIGDLHGHEGALRKIIQAIGEIKPNRLLAFLGDYGDRGPFGPEIICKLLQLEAEYKGQIERLRGNHEILAVAQANDLFGQMQQSAHLRDLSNETLLNFIFESLAQGLLLCVPPQDPSPEKKLPYHFLLLCHAGFDPLIPVKKCIMQLIENHKKTGARELHYDFSHPYHEYSGHLWTDYRANKYEEESASSEVSERSFEMNRYKLPNIYCYNRSAVQDFFDQHVSEHPEHPFILDGIIRGHWPLEDGVGRLNTAASTEQDWVPLEDQKTEFIERGSVYTVMSSTKYTLDSEMQRTSYVDIGFSRKKQQWHLTPHIFSKERKRQSIPTPPPYDQENQDPAAKILTFDESSR